MPRASILIPTHEHADTLPFAVASVQQQRVDDIEILIVGDGVDDALRNTVRQLQTNDRRIRFFDMPKAPRTGELHRDGVLRQAQGRIVYYLSDDDLWLPGHLEAMATALEDADFVGAMQVNVGTDDRVRCHYFDLERPEFTEPWLAWKANGLGAWACNGFGLSFAAHRREAYLRLPEGWATTPPGWSTDQFMWHKFARQPWCRLRFLRWPVALHFPTPDRRDWTMQRRADELERWSRIIAGGDAAARLCREILTDMGDRLLQQDLKTMRERATIEGALASEKAMHASTAKDLAREKAMHAIAAKDVASERALHLRAAAECSAILSSTSWRLTAPLRAAAKALKRFRHQRRV